MGFPNFRIPNFRLSKIWDPEFQAPHISGSPNAALSGHCWELGPTHLRGDGLSQQILGSPQQPQTPLGAQDLPNFVVIPISHPPLQFWGPSSIFRVPFWDSTPVFWDSSPSFWGPSPIFVAPPPFCVHFWGAPSVFGVHFWGPPHLGDADLLQGGLGVLGGQLGEGSGCPPPPQIPPLVLEVSDHARHLWGRGENLGFLGVFEELTRKAVMAVPHRDPGEGIRGDF